MSFRAGHRGVGSSLAALLVAALSASACLGEDPPGALDDTTGDGGTSGGRADGGEADGGGGPAGGGRCATKDDCSTGFCVDGFCCATACDGQCESCGEPGKEGQCVAVSGAPRFARAACAGAGSVCAGSCDGTNRATCSYPTTECRAATCSAGIATAAASCVDGACPAAATTTCADTPSTKLCGKAACLGVSQIVAGYDFTCALMTDQTVRCWGNNSLGQLGQGAGNTDSTNRPVEVVGLTGVQKLTASPAYGGRVCALLNDQTAKCWGGGHYGALGNGVADSNPHPVPAPVLKAAGTPFMGIKDISTGQNVTCLLDTTGVPWCWGLEYYGTVGNGDSGGNTNNLFPVQVTNGGAGASGIWVGYNHACLSTKPTNTSGALCWGDNSGYAIGIEPKGGSIATAKAASIGDIVNGTKTSAVRVGGDRGVSCAITNTSTLACWGSNYYGQLGRNTASGTAANDSSAASPVCRTADNPCTVATSKLTAVTSFGIGEYHACASNSSGVFCWGRDNGYGALGDGDKTNHTRLNASVAVTLPMDAKEVAVGAYHSCALLNDATVRCWGWGNDGQLGNGANDDTAAPVPVLF